MATITSLLDFVMPSAPHLSSDMAIFWIRRAAIKFCRDSKFDRRDLAPFDTTIGEPFYTLTPPDDTKINEVEQVVLDGEVPGLSPLRPDEIPSDAKTKRRPPEWYSASANGTRLQLIYAPAAVQTAFVKVAVEPSASTAVLSDTLVDRYGQQIAFGAMETLLAMPKKPWTDPSMAAYFKGLFDAAILDAEGDVDRGFTPAFARTRPVFGLR